MKQKILVTGGAGFIGSALCKVLNEKGFDVTSLDNYHFGNLKNHHPGVNYIKGNTIDLDNYFDSNVDFKYIYHLGEYARVEQSFCDYDLALKYNYESFPKVVSFAKKIGAKLIYSGSSTKFTVESDGRNMSPYAYFKAQNTEFLINYSKWFGLDYSIVYFYNAYGDHEVDTGVYATVVAKFIRLVNSGEKKLPVNSPGTQLRNFTHIDDIISGLLIAGFKGKGDDYGIGSEEKYSILDLVSFLGAEPIFMESKQGNRMDGFLNTEKTKALGWKPKHSLKDYIETKINKS